MTAPVRLGPSFWRVWTAATVSELGSGLTYVALPLLTVTLTRDPRLVSLVGAVQTCPSCCSGCRAGRWPTRPTGGGSCGPPTSYARR